jgi:Bacterial PH domain
VALLFSTDSIRVHGLDLGFIWLAWMVIFLRLIWKCFDWTLGYFVVTNERIMQVSGVLRRRIKAIWLAQVTGITLKRSVLGEICGYAELVLHSPCPDAALLSLDYAPYPTQLESDLRELAFPHTEHDEGPRRIADSDAAVEPPWRRVSRTAPK